MKEFTLQDTLRVSDSKIKGFVVMEREDGTTVFAKPNMIVENGRNFIKDLVYKQVSAEAENRKFSHIRFGSGITPTSPTDNDLEAHIESIVDTEINITDNVWSEYLGNDDLTGTEDYNNQYKWFNEANDTLYTLNGPGIWNNGVIISTTQPSGSFPIGTKWFNESNNTLYTAITQDTWTGATDETLDIEEPTFSVGNIYYNDKNDKYYEFEPVLSILPTDNAIGLKITIDVTGSSGTSEGSSELGLFLTDGEVSPTYTLFSRVVFDPVPITDTLKYKLTYYIYF